MIVRENKAKGTKFLGCSRFPKCRGTRPYVNSKSNIQPIAQRDLKTIDKPSKYQSDFFNAIEKLAEGAEGHLMLKAGAGTGKTTTEEHAIAMLKKLRPNDSIIYLVYNAHNRKEAQEKGLPALTTHQKFLQDLASFLGRRPKIDDKKVYNIVKQLLEQNANNEAQAMGLSFADFQQYVKTRIQQSFWQVSITCQIVSKVKNTCSPTNDETLIKICDRFQIELNGSQDEIFEMVRDALKANNELLDVIDFDDMLYLVWKLKAPVKKFDWVFGDEVQDWNRLQIELIQKSVTENGHIIVVGDEFQSMYGFRGADLESMNRLQQALNAQVMPLSISYRCAKSHVALVNKLFSHIKFEEFENAKDGQILEMSQAKMMGTLEEGDLVLCRTNAPLVEPVFSLIRQGKKAVIRGRDIGQGLVNLMNKFNEDSVINMLAKLNEYAAKEMAKLIAAEKNSQAQALDDKVLTLIALSDGCDRTWEVEKKIEEVFSDKKQGIMFSTVHRAKGDEAENVYILKPDQMPHPMAKSCWELQQEQNILYVALTRSKNKLVFVGAPAPTVFTGQEIEEIEQQEKIEEPKEEPKQTLNVKSEIKQVPVCPF